MKISAGNWQNKIPSQTETSNKLQETEEKTTEKATDAQRSSSASSASNPSSGSGKIKASMPDDQVGQLATELANSQSKLDVQQVASKVMRSLAQLKMSCAVSEGKEKKKILQLIRRTERLLKRTRTKLRCLTKEEQLENRQKKAEEKKQKEKAKEIQDELRSRRAKRRREERNYALKESAQDRNCAAAANAISMPTVGTGAAPLPSGIYADAATPISDAASLADAAATPAAESISLDVTV